METLRSEVIKYFEEQRRASSVHRRDETFAASFCWNTGWLHAAQSCRSEPGAAFPVSHMHATRACKFTLSTDRLRVGVSLIMNSNIFSLFPPSCRQQNILTILCPFKTVLFMFSWTLLPYSVISKYVVPGAELEKSAVSAIALRVPNLYPSSCMSHRPPLRCSGVSSWSVSGWCCVMMVWTVRVSHLYGSGCVVLICSETYEAAEIVPLCLPLLQKSVVCA